MEFFLFESKKFIISWVLHDNVTISPKIKIHATPVK
jgi:hypothetical protein